MIGPDRPPYLRERVGGPVTLRRSQVQHSTTDQRLLDNRGPTDWVHTDPWRVLRIQSEFVEGFGALAELGPGGQRVRLRPHAAATPGVRAGRGARAGAGRRRLRRDHRRRSGRHGGRQQGRLRGRRASVGLGIELPFEQGMNQWVDIGHQLPLLLRPQDDVRQVRAGVRRAARRLRHLRRAVRGADAGADRGRSPRSRWCCVGTRVLAGPDRLDPRRAVLPSGKIGPDDLDLLHAHRRPRRGGGDRCAPRRATTTHEPSRSTTTWTPQRLARCAAGPE